MHHVVYPKKVKAGAKITYYFEITNVGPHSADYFWIGAILPKGIVSTLKWNGPKGTSCTWEGNEFWCWTPRHPLPQAGRGLADRLGVADRPGHAEQEDPRHRHRQAGRHHL